MLRNGARGAVEIQQLLKEHLVRDGCLVGIAPSEKTADCPRSPLPVRPDSGATQADMKLIRHSVPLSAFRDDWQLCLKSPEISYVLPQLVAALTGVRIIIVYRPLIEIAESMYRKGGSVKNFPVFHRRWAGETAPDGRLVPPPGVPQKWAGLWPAASDFQRCIINAASYFHGLVKGLAAIARERFLVYSHARMRSNPAAVFHQLAEFLRVETAGFMGAMAVLRDDTPAIPPGLVPEYAEMEQVLDLKQLFESVSSLEKHP
jgi:hypothetical protein